MPTLADIQASLEQRFREARKHQANRAAVTLKLLNKTGAYGLKNWAARITTGTDEGQVFSDGADLTGLVQADSDSPIILQWGLYGDVFSTSNLAEDAAAGDPGDYENLVVKEGLDAGDRTATKINKDIWLGPGTAGPQRIHGLTAVAGPLDDTGVYAGVDRAVEAQWASNVFDNGGVLRPYEIRLLEEAIDGTYVASGMTPSAVITTPEIWRRHKQLTKQDALERQVQVGGEQYILDPGVQALLIDGIPIFKDKDCPADTIVGLTMSCIGIERLDPAESRRQRQLLAANIPIMGTPEEQYYADNQPMRELGAELYRLARTGNQEKFAMETKIVLWTNRCNAHFRLADIAPN